MRRTRPAQSVTMRRMRLKQDGDGRLREGCAYLPVCEHAWVHACMHIGCWEGGAGVLCPMSSAQPLSQSPNNPQTRQDPLPLKHPCMVSVCVHPPG